jgi:5-formyltetrahydrofolate cyclo-ligase
LTGIITTSKSEIRRKALTKRDELPELMRIAFSRLIRNATVELVDSLGLKSVHCYLSYRSEVATLGLIGDLMEAGITVIVPVVRRIDGTEVMEHSYLRDPSKLISGAYGIPEPAEPEIVNNLMIDAVILPVAAFDGFGNRIGYGKGFYDKFLHVLPKNIKRIGLSYSVQEVDQLPCEAHDEQLDMIVTEQGITFASESA